MLFFLLDSQLISVSIQSPQDVLGGSSPKFVAFTLVVESSDPNRLNPEVGAFQVRFRLLVFCESKFSIDIH